MTTRHAPAKTVRKAPGGPHRQRPNRNRSLDGWVFRFLGVAFLVQAVASAISGLVFAPVDLLADTAPDDMAGTMADIADGDRLLRASIVGEMVAAVGIVALGTLLFVMLRRYGRIRAVMAFGLYLVEATLPFELAAGLWFVVRGRRITAR